MLHGIWRYDDYPGGTDFSDAILEPLSEAIGRYVRVRPQLEIAIYRARAELDPDPNMTFRRGLHHKSRAEPLRLLDLLTDGSGCATVFLR